MTPAFLFSSRRGPILRERLKRAPPRGDMTPHHLLHWHKQTKARRRRKAGDLKVESWRKEGLPDVKRWRKGGVQGA